MAEVQSCDEFILAAPRPVTDQLSPLTPQILYKGLVRNRTQRFDSDGPGERSSTGPRHDNDHVYINKITLLPTIDECLSLRPPYMPSKDINSTHFMSHGHARNIDVHFRLLRYDSIEKIRDINYNASQEIFFTNSGTQKVDKEEFYETPIGNRYFLYHNLRVEDIVPGENDGVMIRMSFDCPKSLRGREMHRSSRLEQGMLVGVLLLNHDTNELSVQYFNINFRQSTYCLATRNGHEKRAAVDLSILPDATEDEMRNALSIAVGARPNVSMALVEYPKTLYTGFANVLHCLQKMSDFDYAFGQYISPPQAAFESDETKLGVEPPSYAKRPDFAFDLGPLTGNPQSVFSLNDLAGDKLQDTLKHLEQNTTLDRGQAVALLSSLNREMAFTQGPPGCGKTYLSVALTRVLLASRVAESKKPILLVCRTNRALDSLLAGLRDAGVEKLMRIGNGSKAEWTKSINLHAISREHTYSPVENGKRFRINEQKEIKWAVLDAWCQDLSKEVLTGFPCWQHVYPIVRDHYPEMYSQLVTQTTRPLAYAFTYDYWAKGGDLTAIQNLHKELLARLNANVKAGDTSAVSAEVAKSMLAEIAAYVKSQSSAAGKDDIWQLPLEQRTKLTREWQAMIDKHKTTSELLRVHLEHKELLSSLRSMRHDKDIRAMLKQNVVGMTTTACAGRWDLLRDVGFEIMICEEAGEVLEAHSLCALLPTLKHTIHIGDPQQLRPSVEEQFLKLESTRGNQYRLDESLFERIMKPVDTLAKTVLTTKLHIQRRMHPEIAAISRITYPFLQNHESTYSHPLPKGLHNRLWWLDHQVQENAADGVSKSVTNDHEVALVKELVTYLLRGNDYCYGEIAVLTPYSGQLIKLRETLSKDFSVWLSEQDKDSLVAAGAIDPDSDDLDEQKKLNIAMNAYIRLATIDNFQGEEATIVILSMVRSGDILGFTRSANRINVACSRARDGFYVVGDCTSFEADTMWKSIIEVFKSTRSVGQQIRLQCDRHPEHYKFAQSAKDITSFTTCTVSCNQELSCGHLCTEPCHDPALHEIMSCRNACQRKLSCGHQCRNKCGESCGPCEMKKPRYLRSCGHTVLAACSAKQVECDHFEGYLDLCCERHAVGYTCGEPAKTRLCDAVCGEDLACGHQCSASCGNCYYEGKHRNCEQACDEQLPCGHRCKAACHVKGQCPPCKQIAYPACRHEDVKRNCDESPTPCLTTVLAAGPDSQDHETVCCFTKVDSASSSKPQLLKPQETERLVRSVQTILIRRRCALDRQITHKAQLLMRTAALFLMQQDSTDALAASRNIRSILFRTDEVISIQKNVVAEQRLLATFNNSLAVMCRYYPRQVVTRPNIIMVSELNKLELRAILTRAQDTFSTVSFLTDSKDPSGQMQRTGKELALFVKSELKSLLDKYEHDSLLSTTVAEGRNLLEKEDKW